MTIKSDRWIREQIVLNQMIVPAAHHTVREEAGQKVISYGVSSFGYDMRIGNQFKLFKAVNEISDPKVPNSAIFEGVTVANNERLIIPPNSYALGVNVERFKIPRDVLVVVLGKSTLARADIIINVTPLEPEWEGWVTVEISNATHAPVAIYAGEGIAQCLFYQSDEPCEVSYADKAGKYQNQGQVVVPGRV